MITQQHAIRGGSWPTRRTRMRQWWCWVWASERGSSSAELTVLTPLLILMLLFVVLCGRVSDADQRVTDAAHQGARAASIAANTIAAQRAAATTAQASLAGAGITCQHLRVTVDTASLQPGSTVRARVNCTVGLDDLTLLGIPGHTELAASFLVPVDIYGSDRP